MTEAHDWTHRVGDIWASEWVRTDRSFASLSVQLNAAITAASGPNPQTVVDIGCGAGGTSLAIHHAFPDAHIVGIDLSHRLVDVAGARASIVDRPDRLTFVCADVAAAVSDCAPVDLFMSRHGVMFFSDPIAAFRALADAAAPAASLVFSCFADRAQNCWATETVAAAGGETPSSASPAPSGPMPPESIAPGPFAFADAARVDAILVAAGWQTAPPRHVPFAYRAGEGDDPVADAVDYFSRIGPAASLIRDAPIEQRSDRIARLAAVCERYRIGNVVEFPAAAWIWTVRKPSAD